MHYSVILLILVAQNILAKPLDFSLSKKELSNINNHAKEASKLASSLEPGNLINAPLAKEDVKSCHAAFQDMQELVQNKLLQISANGSPKAQIYIFVSFSMPETSLQQWLKQSAKINAAVVIRGMHKNNMRATLQKIARLVAEKNSGAIVIDPVSFTRFNINKVPAVIMVKGSLQAPENSSSDYDVVFGNGSLYGALDKLSSSSLYGKDAREYLALLRMGHA